jgi:hypothetical protein
MRHGIRNRRAGELLTQLLRIRLNHLLNEVSELSCQMAGACQIAPSRECTEQSHQIKEEACAKVMMECR